MSVFADGDLGKIEIEVMNLPELRKDSADKLTQFKPEQIAALQRAAERARLIAEQTGTKLVVAVPPQTPITTGTAPTSEFLDDFGMDARVTGPALAQKMLDEKCLFRTLGLRMQLLKI